MLKYFAFALVLSAVAVTSNAAIITAIRPREGSVEGQTRVTVSGTGFDIRGRSNQVYVGNSVTGGFCDPVPNECTETRIVCLTAAHEDSGALPLTVNSFGWNAECQVSGGSGCTFTYTTFRTPVVTSIFPRYIIAPANITVVGSYFSQGDATVAAFDFTMHLGDEERCSLQTSITNQFVCMVPAMRPGILPLDLILGESGRAKFSSPSLQALVVLPAVWAVSPATGSGKGGQIVTITGAGFSPDVTDNFVTIHGSPCLVNSATPTVITCITSYHAPTAPQARPAAIPGAALFESWYNLRENADDVERGLIHRTEYLQPDKSEIRQKPLSTMPYCGACGYRWTTLFLANESGPHVFAFTGDDGWEVWLADDEVPLVRQPQEPGSGGTRILDVDREIYHKNRIASGIWTTKPISASITLVRGNSYWMRLILKLGYGANHITGTVTTPSGKTSSVEDFFSYVPDWQPPVVVKVSDTTAVFNQRCLARNACSFDYTTAATPSVRSVTPAVVQPLQTITIAGTGFDTSTRPPAPAECLLAQCGGGGCACDTAESCAANAPVCRWQAAACGFAGVPPQCFQWSRNRVTIDGQPCNVTKQTSTSLECAAPFLRLGLHQVVVTVEGRGEATGTYFVRSKATVFGIAPLQGAMNGGNVLTVAGAGFTHQQVAVQVTVGGQPCQVTDASTYGVECLVPPMSGNVSSPVEVAVKQNQVFVTSNAYQYDAKPVRPGTTKIVSTISMTPLSGSIGGGTTVSISLPSTVSLDVSAGVMIVVGGTPCALNFAIGRRASCDTTPSTQRGAQASYLSYTDKFGQQQTIALPSFTFRPSVTWADRTFFSPAGGSSFTLYVDAAVNPAATTVTFAGAPCSELTIHGQSIRCRVPPKPAKYPPRPVLANYTFTGDGNAMTNPLAYVTATAGVTVEGGVAFVPAGGSVTSKALFSRPMAITAWIRPTALPSQGDGTDRSIRIRAGAQASLLSGSFGVAAGPSGTFYAGVDTWYAASAYTQFQNGFAGTALDLGSFQKHRLELHNARVEYYVNDVLIYRIASEHSQTGTAGVGPSAQDIYVKSMVVESLAQEVLTVNVSGEPLVNRFDAFYLDPIRPAEPLEYSPLVTSMTVDADGLIQIRGTNFVKDSSIVTVDPTTKQTTPRSVTVCASLSTRINIVTGQASYYCVPEVGAGSYTVAMVNDNGAAFDENSVFALTFDLNVTRVLPSGGVSASGQRITVVGTGFSTGVQVGAGSAACAIVALNSTAIICDLPAGAGSPLTVTDRAARSATLAIVVKSGAADNAPTITSITPSARTFRRWETITITGTGFTSDVAAFIGYVPCWKTWFDRDTRIRCQVPVTASLSGSVRVLVVQPEGSAESSITLRPEINFGATFAPFLASGVDVFEVRGESLTSIVVTPKATIESDFANASGINEWQVRSTFGGLVAGSRPAVSQQCVWPMFGPFGGVRPYFASKTYTGLVDHRYVRLTVRALALRSTSSVYADGMRRGVLEWLASEARNVRGGLVWCKGLAHFPLEATFIFEHTAPSITVMVDQGDAYLSNVRIELLDSLPYNITAGGRQLYVRSVDAGQMYVSIPAGVPIGSSLVVALGETVLGTCPTCFPIRNSSIEIAAAAVLVDDLQSLTIADVQPSRVTVQYANGSTSLRYASEATLYGVRPYWPAMGKFTLSLRSERFGGSQTAFLRDAGGYVYGVYMDSGNNCLFAGFEVVHCSTGLNPTFTFDPSTNILSYTTDGIVRQQVPADLITFPAVFEFTSASWKVDIRLDFGSSLWDRLLLVGTGLDNLAAGQRLNSHPNAAARSNVPTLRAGGVTYYGFESAGRVSFFAPRGTFSVGDAVVFNLSTQRGRAAGSVAVSPIVSGISATVGGTSGGLEITVGSASSLGGTATVDVFIGGQSQCGSIIAATGGLTCVTLPAADGVSGPVTLMVNGVPSVFLNSTDAFSPMGVSANSDAVNFTFVGTYFISLLRAELSGSDLLLEGTGLAAATVTITDSKNVSQPCDGAAGNGTHIRCVPESLISGEYWIKAANAYGTSNGLLLLVSLKIEGFHPQVVGNSGMATIGIMGEGFGADGDGSAFTITVLGKPICATVIRMNTLILCQTLPSDELVGPIKLTVANGTTVSVDTFKATAAVALPQVTSVAPLQGFGGTNITVVGTGFAGCNVYIGLHPCKLITRTDKQITCTADDELPAGKHKVVVASSVNGSSVEVFDFTGLLLVTSLFPAQGPKEGGQPVTITGKGFSTSMTIAMGGAPCTFAAASYTRVVCWTSAVRDHLSTDMLIALPGEFTEKDVAPAAYTYVAALTASVTAIQPLSGSAGGLETVTITGTGFGNDISRLAVLLGTALCRPDSASDTVITCKTVPTQQAADVPVRVLIEGQGFATSSAVFSFNLHVMSVDVPADGFSVEGGGMLVLRGSGFWPMSDATNWAHHYTSVLLNGWLPCRVLDATETALRCILPASPRPYERLPALVESYASARPPSQTMDITLTANGVAAATTGAFQARYSSTATPVVTSVQTSEALGSDGVVTSGVVFTITGIKFAATGNEVQLGGATCVISSESSTSIVCAVTSGRYGRGQLKVLVPTVGYASLEFECPSGSYLTCRGECLAKQQCRYDEWGVSTCTELSNLILADTFCHANGGTDAADKPLKTDAGEAFDLNCPMYSCEGGDCNVSLSIGGVGGVVSTCGSDPNGLAFDYRAVVSDVQTSSGSRASSMAGGLIVTITGVDFPDAIASVLVFVGSVVCTPTNASKTTIVCQTSASSAEGWSLGLSVFTDGVRALCSGSTCTGFSFSAAATPTMTSVAYSAGSVTIGGNFINATEASTQVTIGMKPCTITSFSASSVVCTVSRLIKASDYPVSISTAAHGNVAGSFAARVRVHIESFSPVNGSMMGGTAVTITGFGFAPTSEVLFNWAASTMVVQQADGSLLATTPKLSGTREVKVRTGTYDRVVAPGNFVVSNGLTPRYTASISGKSITVKFTSMPALPAALVQSDVMVAVGSATCAITSFTATELACTIDANAAAGNFTVTVRVTPFGFAQPAAELYVLIVPTIATFAPTSGSRGGSQGVTITGTGFPTAAEDVTVLFGTAAATIVSSSATQLVVLSPILNTTAAGAVAVDITVTVSDPQSLTKPAVKSAANYQYAATSPAVASVNPSRGSTAGGTRLTIQGSNLDATLTITVSGVLCTQSVAEKAATAAAGGSKMFCTTGAHKPTFQPALVLAMTVSDGAALNADATYQYIDLWSRWTTWGNSPPPQDGDSAVIPEDVVVMIDYSPPKFYLIIVMGTLLFDPTSDIFLECTYIMINYGRFIIGTAEEPFTKQATIRLWGDRLTPEIPVHGAKVIALRHGVISMHGVPRKPTWTHIAATAVAGATNITVRGPVDWKAGEFIVIAPTDFNVREGEPRRIVGVLPADGNADVVTLQLESALQFTHFGERQCFGPDSTLCVDEIAEVMLMTRNIVVEGDPSSQRIGFGGTMFLMPLGHTEDRYCRLSHIELRDVGQHFIVGRYPVHFHVTGVLNNSYCIGLSVHNALNRAYSIHGISNNTYRDNVGYNIEGNAFFFEDGSERHNVVDHNIIVRVKASTSNLNTDITPSAFWIINPLNYVTRNVAVGSDSFGIWISPFAPFSTGPTASRFICPWLEKLGTFDDNVCHSNLWHGVHIFQHWRPKKIPCDVNSGDEQAVLRNNVVYKNNIWGFTMGNQEIGSIGSVIVDNLTAADNGLVNKDGAAFWIEKIQARNMTCGLQNSLLIASTNNNPFRRTARRRGVNLPLGDNFFTENVTFVNFNNENFGFEPQAWAQRMSFCFPWGWEAVSRGLRWVNSPNRILFRFVHHGVLNDEDGTLSGTDMRNTQVVPDTPILRDPSCVPLTRSMARIPSLVCPSSFKIRRLGLSLSDVPRLDQIWDVDGRSEVVPRITDKYSVTVGVRKNYNITFQTASTPDFNIRYGGFTFLQPDDRLSIKVQHMNFPHRVVTKFDNMALNKDWNVSLPNVEANQTSTYGYRQRSGQLQIVLAPPSTSFWTTQYACPEEGCAVEEEMQPWEYKCHSFADAAAWDGGRVPTRTTDVVVVKTRHICLGYNETTSNFGHSRRSESSRQCNSESRTVTYNIGAVTLYGAISLRNELCPCIGGEVVINIEKYLYIRGGGFIIGNDSAPLTDCRVTINFRQAPFDNLEILESYLLRPYGYRALVLEYGLLSLQAAVPALLWTRLRATAAVGASTLTLAEPVQWKVGQVVAIAGTNRNHRGSFSDGHVEQSESATIASVSSDGLTIGLTKPLVFAHLGAAPTMLNGTLFETGAEVALLSRGIAITGNSPNGATPALNAGWRMVVGCTRANTDGCNEAMLMGIRSPGTLHVDGVQLVDAGQASTIPAAVTFDGLTNGTDASNSYFRRSSFLRVYSGAFLVRDTTTGLTLSDNIIYNTWNDAFRVESAGNVIRGNLAIRMSTVDPMCDSIPNKVGFHCRTAMFRIHSGNVVQDNTAASSFGAGFMTDGEPCQGGGSQSLSWSGNVAHSVAEGLFVADTPSSKDWKWKTYPSPTTCRVIGGVTAYACADHGLVGWYIMGNVHVMNFVSVDNSVGSSVTTLHPGRFQTYEPRVTFTNIIYAHQWVASSACRSSDLFGAVPCRSPMVEAGLWCRMLKSTNDAIGDVGALETVFLSDFVTGITKGESLFTWEEADSYSTLYGQASYTNVHFANYPGKQPECSNQHSVAFFPSIHSNDTFHPHYFSKITWDSTPDEGKLWMWRTYGAIPKFPSDDVTPTYYLDFDNYIYGAFFPDGLNKAMLTDIDGSFTGAGALTTLLASETLTRTSAFSSVRWDGRAFAAGSLAPARPGCTWKAGMNAFLCDSRFKWHSLNIENMNSETFTRRSAPLVLCKGDGMVGVNGDPNCEGNAGIDFVSGPVMKGKEQRSTLDRLSRWRFWQENGANYTLTFRSTPPSHLRFSMGDHEYLGLGNDAVGTVINLRYFGMNARSRVAVYVDGKKLRPEFGDGYPYQQRPPQEWPKPTDPAGTHYMNYFVSQDLAFNVISFCVRPGAIIDLIQEPIVQVSMRVSVTVDQFFEMKSTFIAAMASVLGIPAANIHIAKVVAGTTRRSGGLDITWQIDQSSSDATIDTSGNSATPSQPSTGSAAVNLTDVVSGMAAIAENTTLLVAAIAAVAAETNSTATPVVISGVVAEKIVITVPRPEITRPQGTPYISLNVTTELEAFSSADVAARIGSWIQSAKSNLTGLPFSTTIQEGDVAISNVFTVSSTQVTQFAITFLYDPLHPSRMEALQALEIGLRMNNGSDVLTGYAATDVMLHVNGYIRPTTRVPTTMVPTTLQPSTARPSTGVPMTSRPTTGAPSTTTMAPSTTKAPSTTGVPTTAAPTTKVPTTLVPGSTLQPTTAAPTTATPSKEPTTMVPTTEVPTTEVPSTEVPTTDVPTTDVPSTLQPSTATPTTEVPPTTIEPVFVISADLTFGGDFTATFSGGADSAAAVAMRSTLLTALKNFLEHERISVLSMSGGVSGLNAHMEAVVPHSNAAKADNIFSRLTAKKATTSRLFNAQDTLDFDQLTVSNLQRRTVGGASRGVSDSTVPFVVGISIGLGVCLLIGGGVLYFWFYVRAKETIDFTKVGA